MAKLTAKQRNKLPSAEFAGPGRSYPIPDASHARNAKARASQQAAKGNLSMKEKGKIDRMADKKLGHRPEEGMRGKEGRGHDHAGLGSHSGSKVHGEHRSVVNVASHMGKMKNC